MSGPVGVYPGSFDPPTIAHLAVAEAALRDAGLARVDLTLSRAALGKGEVDPPRFSRRVADIRRLVGHRADLGVAVSDGQLIVDLADGHDAVIMGADKWRQVLDPRWYGDVRRRDLALARLPLVLIAPRGDDDLDDLDDLDGLRTGGLDGGPEVRILDLPPSLRAVSSTAVREGAAHAADWVLRGADVRGDAVRIVDGPGR